MMNLRGQRFLRRLRMRARLGLAPAVALQVGCYRYVPADLAAVPVGGHIRVVVSSTAAQQLQQTYGVAGTVLDGRLAARDGDVLTLFVPSVPLGTHALYQEVPVAAADVVSVDMRKVDAFRTGALAVAGAAAATVIAAGALKGATGGTGSGTGGGPTESVRPWTVRVTIPVP